MPLSLKEIFSPARREIHKLVWAPTPKEIEREKQWIIMEIKEVGLPRLENLAYDAAQARKRTYSPQTGYGVGAAMIDIAGETHTGENIEFTTLSETGHAEEQSIKNSVDKGIVQRLGRTFIRALAVSHYGDTSPCGRCRQIMYEFADNALVVVADPEGNIRRITSLNILLPDAFGPGDLGVK